MSSVPASDAGRKNATRSFGSFRTTAPPFRQQERSTLPTLNTDCLKLQPPCATVRTLSHLTAATCTSGCDYSTGGALGGNIQVRQR